MKKFVAASALLFAFATDASASTIDFNADTSSHFGSGMPYVEDGFQISNSANNSDGLLFWGNDWGKKYNADPNGNTLSTNYGGTTMRLSRVDGGLFTFKSIDMGDVYNRNRGGNVRFNFLLADLTTHHETVSLDRLAGLETFSFDFLVSQVEWRPLSTSGKWLQVDNIVVEPQLSQVPVPAAAWLFGSAVIAMIGGVGRHKMHRLAMAQS